MKENVAEHETVPGGMLVVRAILATVALFLLTLTRTDLAAFDPYEFCWNYIRLLAGW
jgi:hypothetical protein